jgi:hypothetical protein
MAGSCAAPAAMKGPNRARGRGAFETGFIASVLSSIIDESSATIASVLPIHNRGFIGKTPR